MTTIPVTILPFEASPREVEEMIEVFNKAFGPDQLMDFCLNRPGVPRTPKEELVAKHLERIATPQFSYYKAVNSDNPNGPILGVAVWYLVEDPHTTKQNIPWGDPPSEVHLECYDASLGALRRWRLNHFNEHNQPFVYMGLLTIVPEAQRRGIGSALLREGLKEVDRRGLPSFIEASPAGLGLYKKFGWEETVKTIVNLKDYGGEDVECASFGLIRPAGAKETIKEQPTV